MALPFIIIPFAVAGGSAVAQAVAKLKSHARLNALQAELEALESQHREEMRVQYDRRVELCVQLGLAEPDLPSALEEKPEEEATEAEAPRWRRFLRRRNRTVADGSPHSRVGIIGRHGGSFAAGTVWRVVSTPVINAVRPVALRLLAYFPRVASLLPRLAVFGGTGGSIAASTGLRFALSAFNIIGIIVGPALAGWAIFREIRNVRKAHHELEAARIQRRDELAEYAAGTLRLEQQAAASPVDVVVL